MIFSRKTFRRKKMNTLLRLIFGLLLNFAILHIMYSFAVKFRRIKITTIFKTTRCTLQSSLWEFEETAVNQTHYQDNVRIKRSKSCTNIETNSTT